MRKRSQEHKVHLVNRLEFLSDGKYGLDVVVAQFLNQMGDGGVILAKHLATHIYKISSQLTFKIPDYVGKCEKKPQLISIHN